MPADTTPDAFLSYTRIDDQFYGGAITSLRKLLELGVQVVTGSKTFSIFQDIDGTGLGQQYQKLFDEVLANALVFIPIITPLFFNSEACRGELQKFLAHENKLGRDDLILPIYYVTAPVLEKPDLLASDPLASEIRKRQNYDWRQQADLAIDDPKIRPAVKQLAEKIGAALERTTQQQQQQQQQEQQQGWPEALRPGIDSALRDASEILKKAESPRQKEWKTVLWVDDNPDNNVHERRAMAAYDIKFELALSTDEALTKLKSANFDAIISDMGRRDDRQAGFTLLRKLRDNGDRTPYFIFSSINNAGFLRKAKATGAQWSTNRSDELVAHVLQYLQPPAAT